MRRRRYGSYGRKKSSNSLTIILLGLLIGAGAYMFTSKGFERNAPIVHSEDFIYWNRKSPLQIKISDDTALKSYRVYINDGEHKVEIANDVIPDNAKEKIINIVYPKQVINGIRLDPRAEKLQITIEVNDKSNWNFFQGNNTIKRINVEVDYKRPDINILSNSYSITRGGVGLVVFQVKDKDLKSFYVEADGNRFKAEPYKKSGYYATLIVWPYNQENFSANIVAEDKAGNRRVSNVPFYLVSRKYKTSFLEAKDKFIDGKISDLIASDPDYLMIEDRLEKLKAINEVMRTKNEKLIHTLSSKVSDELLTEWKINRFYPLKNAAKVASFGDDRHYYYKTKDNEVSESKHVGLDLASTKMAKIVSSNAGTVVYADDNGIYGNMPMIDHGLGLYTIYGHCSNIIVKTGDKVNAGFVIAQTGKSGLALGDHLHFGVLVQGIEVRPEEWMDRKWIRDNIDKVFKSADKIIEGE